MQRDTVGSGFARCQHARAAQPDGHIGFERALDQETVGDDRLLAVRVDDLQVVQAQRGVAEVERGADPGRIHDLPLDRLVLGDVGPHQLENRVVGELGATHVDRHPAAVAALVHMHGGDRKRHDLGQQLDLRVRLGLAVAADQDVVIPGFGERDDGSLVGLQRVLVGGVVIEAVGHVAIAYEDLVGGVLVGRAQAYLERLALAHGQPVDPALASGQRGRQRDTQMQFIHRHRQRIGRGGGVVGFPGRAVRAFEHFVEDIGAHDHAVLPRFGGRDEGVERRRIAAALPQNTGVVDLAQQAVTNVPDVVVGEVDRVGPAARGRVAAVVGHRPLHVDVFAGAPGSAENDLVDLHIGRRRQLEDRRRRVGRGVVALETAFEDLAAARTARRIGDHKHVIRANDVQRRAQALAHRVAAAHGQSARMLNRKHVAVAVEIEQGIAR